jgi:hypothetical protein
VSHAAASGAGSRFVATSLAAVATCRRQGQDVLDGLAECCRACLHRHQDPPLVPGVAGAISP